MCSASLRNAIKNDPTDTQLMERPTAAERRQLARLERRAVAAYERDLLTELRELAVVEAACSAIAVRGAGLLSVELQLSGRRLVMLGLSTRTCSEVEAMSHSGLIRIVAAGRYDRRWWIGLSDGQRSVVVLGLRAYLSPNDGGLSAAQHVA